MSCHDTGMPPTFRKVRTHSHFFLFFSLTQLTPLHSDRLPILTEEPSLFSFFSIRCHSSISLRALPGDHFTTWFQCVNASGWIVDTFLWNPYTRDGGNSEKCKINCIWLNKRMIPGLSWSGVFCNISKPHSSPCRIFWYTSTNFLVQ